MRLQQGSIPLVVGKLKCLTGMYLHYNMFSEAVETTRKADEVVVVVGLDQTQEKRDKIE